MAEKKELSPLAYIQSTLKAPKNQFNSFGNYKYRSCEDILEAVKPLLKDVNCTLVISDEIVQVADRIYVKATVTFKTDLGEVYTNSAFAREPIDKKGMDASQITGMASSYARKYALNGMFCIDDTRDADTMDNTDGAPSSPTSATKGRKGKNEATATSASQPAPAPAPAPAAQAPVAPVAPQAPATPPVTFSEAKKEIDAAPSVQALMDVWSKHPELQNVKEFRDACGARRKQIENPTA